MQSEPTWLLSYTRLPTHWISSWDEIQWVFCDGSNRTWAPGDNSDYGEELQQQKLDVKYLLNGGSALRLYVRQPATAY